MFKLALLAAAAQAATLQWGQEDSYAPEYAEEETYEPEYGYEEDYETYEPEYEYETVRYTPYDAPRTPDRTPTTRPGLGFDGYAQTIWDRRTDRRARRYDDDLPRHYDYRPRLNDGVWKYFNRHYDAYDFVVDRFVPNQGAGLGYGPYQLYGNDADYDYFNRGQWRGAGLERATGGRSLEGVGPRVLSYRKHGNNDYHYSGVTGDDYYGPSARQVYNDAYLGDVKKGTDWGWNGRGQGYY